MKKSILATLPIAAAVALGAGVVVPNTSAIEPSSPICSDNVKDYVSFESALDQCTTITLGGDVQLNTPQTIGKALTINLNGKNLTIGASTALTASGAGASLTINGTGKISSSEAKSGTIVAKNGATLTINTGATIENTGDTGDYEGSAIENDGSTLIINEGARIISSVDGVELKGSAKLTMNGGEIRANTSTGISSWEGGSTIDIKGGAIASDSDAIGIYADADAANTTLTISGGNLEAGGNGVTFETPGTITMTGGRISADMAGIEVGESGSADIRGGIIVADGTSAPAEAKEFAGVAVLVYDETGTSKVTISAPTIISATNEFPVATINDEDHPDASNPGNAIVVNAGVEFTGTRPAIAYLAPGLAVGPNGVVTTTAEAEAMAGATENPENPNTADHIAVYVTIAVLALVGLGATILVAKKSRR